MNLRGLAWKNLRRRKSKALFTGFGIFLGIATFVGLSSLTASMEDSVREKLDRFGANILITPKTEQLSLGFGDVTLAGATVAHARLTQADADRIHTIKLTERIRAAVPYFLFAADASGSNLVWMGLPPAEMAMARPWWKVVGAEVPASGEVILGAEAASLLDKGPGGTLESGNRVFRVAGVLEPTGEKEDSMVVADIADVRFLAGVPDGVSFIEVAALCQACPIEEIVKQLEAGMPGAKVSAIRSVVAARQEAVDQFRRLGLVVSGLVLLVGGLMVFLTVMGSVSERTREIGVLRAIGFRRVDLFALLFYEAGWVSLIASTVGAGVGLLAGRFAGPLFGIEHAGSLSLTPGWQGILIGLLLGILGTIPPARRAAALPPTEAIRSL